MLDYARDTSAAAVAAAAAAACVCAFCSTAVMRRLSIDATGARCAVRAFGMLYGVRVARSQAPEPRAPPLLSLTAR